MSPLNSNYKSLGTVILPSPELGRQFYMHSFDLFHPTVPKGFEDYLLPVQQLIWRAGAFYGEGHLTIDEKIVKAGTSQRRPKPHVDGCFIPVKTISHADELKELLKRVPVGSWAHNNMTESLKKELENPSGYWGHGGGGGGGWNHNCNNIPQTELKRMPVIVAASASGCKVWKGTFDAVPKSDGDLSHIADQLGVGKIVPANQGYLLSADCVHESMILDVDTPRTFIRIALPNNINYGV